MAQKSRPDPNNGTVVTADEYEALGLSFGANGIYGSPSDTPVVYADATGRQVKVRAGKMALVRGYEWYSDPTTDEIINNSGAGLPANTSGNPRIDRLVLRLDRSARTVRTQYLQGTAAGSPSAPALTQSTSISSGYYDFPLARWNVASGYTTVAAADLTVEHWYPKPAGVILCTSTSRPFGADLYQGMRIHETDTKLNYTYSATLGKFLRDEVWLRKTASQSVNSSTPVNDSDLYFAGEAGGIYAFDIRYGYTALSTPKFSLNFNFPSGARVDFTRQERGSDGNFYNDFVPNVTSSGFGNTSSPAPNSYGSIYLTGIVSFGSTPGNFQLAIAQYATDNANPSYGLMGSTMSYRQLA